MTPSDNDRLVRIETKLDEVLKPLVKRVDQQDTRLGSLERSRSYATGLGVVFAGVVSAIARKVL